MWPLYILLAVAIAPLLAACFLKNRILKVLCCVIALVAFFLACVLLAGFVFPDWIGPDGTWLPFALCGCIYAGFLLLIFKPYKDKVRRIALFSITGLMVALAAVFIVPPLYTDSVPQAVEEVNLRQYMPFGEETMYANGKITRSESAVAKLQEASTLQLTGELPRLDGATALYPLYAAFVRATYPESGPNVPGNAYFPYSDLRSDMPEYRNIVACSTTPYAFENLIDGYADIVFLMGVSGEQRRMAEARGVELVLTPIGREAFIFFVNSRNTAENLTTDDIRRIYTGEVTNWSEVGGGSGDIQAYQRPEGSGSQTALLQIMGDTPPVPAPMEEIFDSMAGMYERVADYRNYRNSLGYSFLYYIQDMIGENKVKFLSVDGIAPTVENIGNGTYPFADSFYAITARNGSGYLNPERTENIDKLLEWMQSPQGQYLVGETGYVALSN